MSQTNYEIVKELLNIVNEGLPPASTKQPSILSRAATGVKNVVQTPFNAAAGLAKVPGKAATALVGKTLATPLRAAGAVAAAPAKVGGAIAGAPAGLVAKITK